MNKQIFVHRITTDNDGVEHVSIIGPFATSQNAADWGHTYCAPGGPDDPRWNSVTLDIPDRADHVAIAIEKPAGDYEHGCYGR